MLRRWVVAACAREWGHAVDRSDFEVLQRAVLPAFAPLLRKHPSDPKCKTTELCFLLRAGWVVVGPLRGRGCSWCAPAGGARAKCGPWGGLHRDFWGHPSHLCPYSSRFFSFSLLLSTSGRARVMLGPGAAHGFPPSSGACHRGAHQQRAKKNWPRSDSHVGGPGRYCSRGDERRFFPYPSFAGGLGELRGARGWLTWRCWPENATLAHTRGALQAVVEAAVMGRNGRGSGRYAGLGERKSHFLQ